MFQKIIFFFILLETPIIFIHILVLFVASNLPRIATNMNLTCVLLGEIKSQISIFLSYFFFKLKNSILILEFPLTLVLLRVIKFFDFVPLDVRTFLSFIAWVKNHVIKFLVSFLIVAVM